MRRKTKKYNIFKILSIILILVFILSLPLIIQKVIKIKKIECISQFGNCDGLMANRLQTTDNLTNSKKQIKQILDQDIQINSYLIQYKIPSTLKVEINIKKPKYAVFYNQKYFLLDNDGLILSEAGETNLPTLVVSNFNNNIGDIISNSMLFSLRLIEKVAWLYSVKIGTLTDNELKITLKEGVLVHFPLEGDIDTLVGNLRLIFSRLNDEGEGIRMEDIREIDLRFKQPILR